MGVQTRRQAAKVNTSAVVPSGDENHDSDPEDAVGVTFQRRTRTRTRKRKSRSSPQSPPSSTGAGQSVKRAKMRGQSSILLPEQEASVAVMMLRDAVTRILEEAVTHAVGNPATAAKIGGKALSRVALLPEAVAEFDEASEESGSDDFVVDDDASIDLDELADNDKLEFNMEQFLDSAETGQNVFAIPEDTKPEVVQRLNSEFARIAEFNKKQQFSAQKILESPMLLKDKVHLMRQLALYQSLIFSEEKLQLADYINNYITTHSVSDPALLAHLQNEADATATCSNETEQLLALKERFLMLKLEPNLHNAIAAMFREIEQMSPEDVNYRGRRFRLDWILRFPFGKIKPLPVERGKNTPEEIAVFLSNTRAKLDADVLFQTDVKDQIMMTVASYVSNPRQTPVPIALEGPPGVGKSTLVMKGVAEALDLPFFLLNAGGTHDASEFRGIDDVWMHSGPGKFFRMAVQAECLNFVVLVDEIDKVSNRVNETLNVFSALFDPTMSRHMEDGYFKGVYLDFSRVLKFTTYNSRELLGDVFSDRIQKMVMHPYSYQQKIQVSPARSRRRLSWCTNPHMQILKQVIIPRYLKFENLTEVVEFHDAALAKIIDQQKISELGVRQLERNVQTLVKTLGVLHLIQSHNVTPILKHPRFQGPQVAAIRFPVQLTPEMVDALWFEPENAGPSGLSMFV